MADGLDSPCGRRVWSYVYKHIYINYLAVLSMRLVNMIRSRNHVIHEPLEQRAAPADSAFRGNELSLVCFCREVIIRFGFNVFIFFVLKLLIVKSRLL